MQLSFTTAEIALREDLRATLRKIIPEHIRRNVLMGRQLSREEIVFSQSTLNSHGLAVPHWPTEYGGRGFNAVEVYIYREELSLAGVPEPQAQTVDLIAPLLMAFGTEEQKSFFLPRLANLDFWVCQGFSEPNAGSDLASLRTSAVHDGDDYVINGQKMWTTAAHHANWMFCLVRTDSAAARPQRGLTLLMLDMTTPGITVRPVVTIDRRHETNEVFFDNVRVPIKNRIGEENKGWNYSKYLLSRERLKMARVGLAKQQVARTKELSKHICAGDIPLAKDARFRERLAALEVELKALEMTAMRVLATEMASPDPNPDPASSLLKMKGCELLQAATELMMQLAGPAAVPYYDDDALKRDEPLPQDAEWAASIAPVYFFSRVFSISGGSNEIQRNIIAKTMLGM